MNKVMRYNSLVLGAAIFAFGVLKLVNPFNSWFHTQVVRSGLPSASIPLGIASEVSVGLALLLAPLYRERLGRLFGPIVLTASAGLVGIMAVATYVHLQPEVPANVLPLGLKRPYLPVAVMLMAGFNLFQALRTFSHVSCGDPVGTAALPGGRRKQVA